MIPYFLRPLASSLSRALLLDHPKRAHPVLRPIGFRPCADLTLIFPSPVVSASLLPLLFARPPVLLPFAIHDDVEIALVEKRKMMIGQKNDSRTRGAKHKSKKRPKWAHARGGHEDRGRPVLVGDRYTNWWELPRYLRGVRWFIFVAV
jgi:hypothetical protein